MPLPPDIDNAVKNMLAANDKLAAEVNEKAAALAARDKTIADLNVKIAAYEAVDNAVLAALPDVAKAACSARYFDTVAAATEKLRNHREALDFVKAAAADRLLLADSAEKAEKTAAAAKLIDAGDAVVVPKRASSGMDFPTPSTGAARAAFDTAFGPH